MAGRTHFPCTSGRPHTLPSKSPFGLIPSRQLFTTHEDPILIASFRSPKDGRPHLLLEREWDLYANLDMIVVTFLLLDRDRKRGKH